ncbi:MAG: ATP synthase F1 subunit delta [Candidatus Gastranaerophilales bacterium]|nr:ATP synthase F1 subunit delta [bacterium]MBR2069291.1 ATP synthase F1 subunit delta [Candidatus Gastranaerophilales bacterium]
MNNKNSLSIAKRYAKSLIEIMLESDNTQAEIREDLNNVKEILKNSPDLNSAMTNPVVSAYDKEQIISSVFERDTKETTRNFLKLLVEKNRFNLIFQIIDTFNEMLNKINNIVKVQVTGAIELEDNTKEEIQNKLKEKLNKEIDISYKVDNSIIAGLIYKIEDDVLDTSFLHKLEELKKELIK